ncbi:DUF2577 domain-containing protein [Enterococcus olivae]
MPVENLARRIKSTARKDSELSDLVYGTVTSTAPLKILVENRFEVWGNFIELSTMVKDLTVSITIDGQTGSARIFRNLQTGDRVRMLRAQKSQKFYVLERV